MQASRWVTHGTPVRVAKKKKMRLISRFVNVRGELFASTLSYGLSILIKLGSTLVLTRLLDPTAYGVIGILFSVAFTLELLSDVGTAGLLIRNPRGGEKKFIHTLWTIRLGRSIVNFALLYAAAPLIAQLYGLPLLTDALRLFAFWFPLVGLESMSFSIAQRQQRAKIGNYFDLGTSAVMTLFVIGMATVINDYNVFIYGSLLQRLLTVIGSHFLYREIGVGFAFDREAIRDQMGFAKYVMPSSLMTIALSQYDKIVLLKLFDLSLLGIYGLAANMAGPVANLVNHNCRAVLYPRCAEYFRSTPARAGFRYYSENVKLIAVITIPAMVIAGFSQTLVALLYDTRYQSVGMILMAMGISVMFTALQASSEQLLIAGGHTRVGLIGNVVRLLCLVPATLIGYYFFGFPGFVWAGMAANVPVLAYYYRAQRRAHLLDIRWEARRILVPFAFFAACLAVSSLLLPHIPPDFIRHALHIKPHGPAASPTKASVP